MKGSWNNGRLVISLDEKEFGKRKQIIYEETGHETLEIVLDAIRKSGIKLPITPYEQAVKRLVAVRRIERTDGEIS